LGCDSGSGGQAAETTSTVAPTATGTVLLQLEKIDGALIEGFELDVRLDSPTGHRVVSSTWDDLVHDLHAEPTMDQYYESVVRTAVPAGPFVVTTVMHPGMEREQEPCISRGTLEPGAVVSVTVKFWDKDGCSTLTENS
jgi:hypothetical protein